VHARQAARVFDKEHLDVITLKRYNSVMSDFRRATVYLDPNLRKALRVKAAQTEKSMSELVNAAIRRSLVEDAEDLAVFDARAKEPNLVFENVLKDLKRRGKL
jgi:plasmid stability protein